MCPYEIVQPVAAGMRLLEQARVDQVLQEGLGVLVGPAQHGGEGEGVETGGRSRTQRPEATPQFGGELVVRHPEGGLHAAVPGPELAEAARVVGHPVGEEGQRPGRAVLQPGARDAQRQRKAAAAQGELASGLGLAVRPGLAEELPEQADGVAGAEWLHGEPEIGVEARQAM